MEIEAQEQQDSPDALCHELKQNSTTPSLFTGVSFFAHTPPPRWPRPFHVPLVVRPQP